MDLQNKTTRAVMWSSADVILRQGLQFFVSILLARLLTPDDFGVIAMLSLFVGVAGVFIDSGFSSALIQRQNTTAIEESTVFYFNIGMGAVASLILCALAPWIATFFKQPALHYLTYAMALNIFINTFGSIHTTLITRDLEFKTIMRVGVSASFLSGLIAIILAWRGFGVWSLAVQALTSSVISVFLLWTWHSWRPIWSFNAASLRSFFNFGGYLMATGLVDTLHINLNSVMIGKLYSARDVGFYDRAQRMQQLPVNILMGIINRVAYPVFSAAAEDKERLGRGLRKAQRLIMFVNIPILISMIILAEPLVITLLGPQWKRSVPILQVLGLVGLLWPLHVLNLNVLNAQGRSDLFFRIMLLKKAVAISLTVAASFQGVMAIAWAQVVASTFAFFVNAHYSRIFLDYGAVSQIRDLAYYFLASVPMGLGIWLVINAEHLSYPVKLIFATVSGTVLYLFACRLMHVDTLNEIVKMYRSRNLPMT